MGGTEESLVIETKPFIELKASQDGQDLPVANEKEQIIDAIGGWGRWQRQRFALVIAIIWLPGSFHLLNMIFYRAETDFWCKRPVKFEDWSVAAWRDLSSPGWNSTNSTLRYEAQCKVLDLDYDQLSLGEDDDLSSLHTTKVGQVDCTAWEYDRSFWRRTIIMDFDLVCGRKPLRKLQQQMTFLGLMMGVSTAGFVSDRFGRRKTMAITLACTVIIGTASAFSPSYPVFLVGVFFCAFMALGYGTVMYCWMMEHADGKVKTILGAAPHYNFGFWGLMTAVIAYCVPDWRHMQLIFSLPLVLLFGAFWVMPESARWLLANGRVEEAEEIIHEIARTNGRVLPAGWHLTPPKQAAAQGQEPSTALSFFRIFALPNMRRKTLICYYLWFSTALVYYGLTLNSNTLGSDLFVTFSIGKVLEFPSITLVIFLLLKTGRRATLMLFYTLAGVSLTATIVIPLGVFAYEWPIVVLNILGRISAISTLAVCYIYSAEVFPTVIRNVGLGSSSFWARVGPMIAPFIADLRVYGEQVPLAVFGVVALLAAVLVTFMPETSKTPLPDTLKEGEELGADDTFWSGLTRRRKKKTET